MEAPVQVLPSGSTLPPLSYFIILAVAVVVVAIGLYRTVPQITDRVMVSFVPWMITGASCYVLSRLNATPEIVRPFFTSPTVYISVAVVAGAVWAGATMLRLPAGGRRLWSVPEIVGSIGCVAAVAAIAPALLIGTATSGGLAPEWPAMGLAVAVVVSLVVWVGLRRLYPRTKVTGAIGTLCLFGHALDGVSTAVGLEVLGFGEQSPFSRTIIEFAAGLPTASIIGSVWLFVVVKLVLASVVVILLSGYVGEEPAEGYLLLGGVTAVGLGPSVHNLLLFTANL